MVDGLAQILVTVSAIASGLVAGVFFAFSTFIMRALARLPAPTGIAAMQSINVEAPSPLFMLALFGNGAVAVATAVVAIVDWGEPYTAYAVVGAALYLVTVVLTIVFHVPRNNALAAIEPNDPRSAEHWSRYVASWTAANHVRTVAPLAAAIVFTLALRAT